MIANGRRALSARIALPPLCVLALSAPGCFRHHTIEPGVWRFKIEARDTTPEGKQFVRKPREVNVDVNWSKEMKGVEEVKVSYESRNDDQVLERALTGKIEKGGKNETGEAKVIKLEGFDQAWYLWLTGRIFGPESMGGSAFARGRLDDKLWFEGTWTLVKVKPEE